MLNEIDLSRSDLNLLVIFEAILAEGNVGRAAERLNLSPSAVSHSLGRLRRLFNDPLFLKTPKGVVPTARASELAEPIADILARTRKVIASAEPFDPATSKRRFVIGAPDGVSAVFLKSLDTALRRDAPGIDIGLRQLLPRPSMTAPWDDMFGELDAHALDIAILPIDDVPARFATRRLYGEDFVIAMRRGHRFAEEATLPRYCEMRHLLVSITGDPAGYVDGELAKLGLSRRIAMTVPNFMMALAILAETEMVAALPERLVVTYAPRFDIVAVRAPLALRRFDIRAVVPKAALMDAGIAWLLDILEEAVAEASAL